QLFLFDLSGSQEVPANASTAQGGCAARFDAGSSTLSIVCVHDVVGATIMHVHHGDVGATGSIAFDLGSPVSPVIASWIMSPADVAELFAGDLYVNIHNSGRPDGEI